MYRAENPTSPYTKLGSVKRLFDSLFDDMGDFMA
jgi:hypothetical protein